jgi:PPE-repeat protein
MDFGIYPPEINSGRMYAGPGSGPMLAAAQAWGALADELYTAASSYQSVASDLTSDSWSGPSATAMSAAAGSYVEWLSATATQAEQTASQASAAAAAYDAAFASTVPPPEIAANRSLLAALVATNFLGQNTPAIAATEALYAEMWAQDAVAMYTYAGSAAAATALTPFTSPNQNTTPGGTANQAAAAGQAAGTTAGDAQNVVSSIPQTLSAVPNALESAATPTPAATSGSLLDTLNAISELITIFLGVPGALSNIPDIGLSILAIVDLPFGIGGTLTGLTTDHVVSTWEGVADWPATGPADIKPFPATLLNLPEGTVPAPWMSASLGSANSIGRLSVPRGWTVDADEVRPTALESPLDTQAAPVAQALEDGSANTFNQMGIGGMAGQAMAGPPAPAAEQNGKAVTHARLTSRITGAAADGEPEATPAPRTVVTGVAAAIRDIAKQRAQGYLTEQEYTEQKKRLLEISAGHRPLA